MPNSDTAASAAVDALLDTTIDHTRDDLRRADTTAGAYTLILIGLGTIVADLGADLPTPVAVAAALTAAPAAVTFALLLAVVKPRIHDSLTPGSWTHSARQTGPTALRGALEAADLSRARYQQAWVFARIVAAKTRWLRRATIGLAATIGCLVAIALYGAVAALI